MSIIQVTASTGAGAPMERTSFVGPRVPDEIRQMIKPLKQLEKTTFRTMLQVIVAAMEGNDIDKKLIDELHSEKAMEETIATVYTGLHKLLQSALRLPLHSLKMEHFKEDVLELGIPEEFIQDLSSVVFGSRREHILHNSKVSRPRLPKLESFRWRVDVSISTSVLNRVLEPSVMMEMTLSDGRTHTFEVPVSKFHELRYNVAYVLKEIEDLEKRSILKIQD